VVSCLYWAQVVFIPLALAVFLTFLLGPAVAGLERRRLGRIPSVVVVVLLAALLLLGGAWMVTHQLTALALEVPKHTENVKVKIRSLRDTFKGKLTERFSRMADEITGELESKSTADKPGSPSASPGPLPDSPPAVVIQPESPPWLSRLPTFVMPALQPIGSLGLAIVLTVFMLHKREDVRNRFIRMVGRSNLITATKAVDDAGARISRYLLMQLIVNGTYGFAWGVGLWLIGVEYAMLWGFLAAALRYVPFIGAPLAALLPISLSLVAFEGWSQVLLIIGLLTVLELLSNNVMEPWLYGQSIGVSAVALIVAAAFWTFLWGPIGLILSGPLTVCLVVLGRYVPQLAFLDVLLGDEPVLDPAVSYYQRLLAADQEEAIDIARTFASESSVAQACDALLIPSLVHMNRDKDRDELPEGDESFILRATSELLDEFGARLSVSGVPTESSPHAANDNRVVLLACPARDKADQLAIEMLQKVLDNTKWDVQVAGVELTAAELTEIAAQTQPGIICIGSLPPGGLSHTRYLCKKFRSRLPGAKIFVGRWGLKSNFKDNEEQALSAGADAVTTTLMETANQLTAWLPVMTAEERSNLRTDGAATVSATHAGRLENARMPPAMSLRDRNGQDASPVVHPSP
jgi:predicted PurR-regulated permease PerM